jgi:hypothetical protein
MAWEGTRCRTPRWTRWTWSTRLTRICDEGKRTTLLLSRCRLQQYVQLPPSLIVRAQLPALCMACMACWWTHGMVRRRRRSRERAWVWAACNGYLMYGVGAVFATHVHKAPLEMHAGIHTLTEKERARERWRAREPSFHDCSTVHAAFSHVRTVGCDVVYVR